MTPNFERLMQIAADVRATPEELFYMGFWRSEKTWEGNMRSRYLGCGTVGCAIGRHIICHPESELKIGIDGNPWFRGLMAFEAITAYAELGPRDASYLFGISSYRELSDDPDREMVASRIEQFCLDHGYAAPVEQSFVQMKPERQPTPCAV